MIQAHYQYETFMQKQDLLQQKLVHKQQLNPRLQLNVTKPQEMDKQFYDEY